MPRIQFPSIPTKTLSQAITSSATSFQLTDILDWAGSDLTSAAFGDRAFAVFKSVDGSKLEIMRIDPTTIASSSITIVKRGLSYHAEDYDTEATARKLDWNANETLVELGSNPPQLYAELARKNDDESITGLYTFSVSNRPKLDTDANATADEEFVTKGELSSTALGTLSTQTLVVAGTAGETIAAGELVYFDSVTNNEWMKADADTAASVENVQLGIAQGAGTDGVAITGGVLLKGVDDNQSGLTAGEIQYASNTAGGIANSAGTTEVTVGIAIDADSIYFNPRFNQQLTEDQQDALAGTSGTPSNSNKYVTADDVSAAGVTDKIVRLNGTAYPAGDGSALTNLKNQFGGDGSDGAKNVTASENIDASSATYVLKQYTSLTVDAGQTLGLTNPAAAGTILHLKVSGNCTINGTIDVDAMGGDGGSASGDGTQGTGGWSNSTQGLQGADGGSNDGSGGGGGGAHQNAGSAGSTGGNGKAGGAASTALIRFDTFVSQYRRAIFVSCGSGGGGGGNAGGTGGVGGKGGGVLILEVKGDLTFGASSNLTADGAAGGTGGTDGANGDGGGGGGGAGGQLFVLYNGTLTDGGVTATVTGGAGGSGGGSGGTNDGGNGGAGGAGDYYIAQNTEIM